MQNPTKIAVACAALAALTAAVGCASPPPERFVYEVHDIPALPDGALLIPPPSSGPVMVVRDDPASEAARRAWLEENYGRRRGTAGGTPSVEERYVPPKDPVRERVIVVEREPRHWVVPAPQVSVGWVRTRGHGHWGWGLGWGWPLWCR